MWVLSPAQLEFVQLFDFRKKVLYVIYQEIDSQPPKYSPGPHFFFELGHGIAGRPVTAIPIWIIFAPNQLAEPVKPHYTTLDASEHARPVHVLVLVPRNFQTGCPL